MAALFQLLPLHLLVFVVMFLARDEAELQILDADLNHPQGLGVLGSGALAQPWDEGSSCRVWIWDSFSLDSHKPLLRRPGVPRSLLCWADLAPSGLGLIFRRLLTSFVSGSFFFFSLGWFFFFFNLL